MQLIPRSVRPMALVRRRALRRGLRGNSAMWRWIAVIVIGRSSAVRHVAFRDGLRRGNRFWRIVAYGILVSDVANKVAVKRPERLATERLVAGQAVEVRSLPASARRAAS